MGSGAKMNWKALSDVKNENMGHGEKVQYLLTYSTVHIHSYLHMKPHTAVQEGSKQGRPRKKKMSGWQHALYQNLYVPFSTNSAFHHTLSYHHRL